MIELIKYVLEILTSDTMAAILWAVTPVSAGVTGVYIKKALFLAKVAKQTLEVFEGMSEGNREIHRASVQDVEGSELTQVLEGKVKSLMGLTGLGRFDAVSNEVATR